MVLPFTSSVDLAQKALHHLPVGGKTPLSAGLMLAYRAFRREMRLHPKAMPLMILLTDGAGNVSLTETPPQEECHKIADLIHRAGIHSVVINMEHEAYDRGLAQELAHALDRLTGKLAETYVREPDGRALVRLMFTSVGRGGEGQRIRDEILEIMHRHHVKEVSGHFLEEWHQKLHNNTTPDDVVICQAYLAFLRHRGDLRAFFDKALGAAPVHRQHVVPARLDVPLGDHLDQFIPVLFSDVVIRGENTLPPGFQGLAD